MNTEPEEQVEDDDMPDNIIPFPINFKFECSDCRGRGLITIFIGHLKGEHKCPKCNGSGRIGAT
jgi:DnaJ-class molecular chaperone